MHKRNMFKAVIAFVIALAFVMPGAVAFANIETSTNNNFGTTDTLSYPDLTPTLITVTDPIDVNAPNVIDVTIGNIGPVVAGGFNVHLYAGWSPTGNVPPVGDETVTSLDPSSSTVVSFTWTPGDTGIKVLKVVVDPNDAVTELDETNNILRKWVEVEPYSGTVWEIHPNDPPGTVNGAMQSAASGDTIFFYSGIYNPYGGAGLPCFPGAGCDGQSLTAIGEGADVVTFDLMNNDIRIGEGNWEAPDCVLDGFRFVNTKSALMVGQYSPAPNATVRNCVFDGITTKAVRIGYKGSENTTLEHNLFTNNKACISFYKTSNCILRDNIMSGNNGAFGFSTTEFSHHIHDIDTSNLVDGKPVYYWVDQQDQQIPSDAGFVGIVNSTNITVKDLTLSGAQVRFAHTTNSRIENVDVSGSNISDGIYLCYSHNNTVTNNNIANSLKYAGVKLDHSDNNTVTNNKISNYMSSYGAAIYLGYLSNNNTVADNTCENNKNGIALWGSSSISPGINNIITRNNIISNVNGIYSYRGSLAVNNKIFLNNIIGNTENVFFKYTHPTNIWNSTDQIEYAYSGSTYTNYLGNYWDDYTGIDNDGNGIGDTPYDIPSSTTGEQDHRPLMNPWENFDFAPEITGVTLTTSDLLDTIIGWENVSCTVTDVAIDTVQLNITAPTPQIVPMVPIGDDVFFCNITLTDAGNYTYHIWANDINCIDVISSSKEFALPMNEDVDNNGQVYFDDLVDIVMIYGDTGPGYPDPSSFGWVREDVDNNGQAYFDDLVAVVMEYGESWWT